MSIFRYFKKIINPFWWVIKISTTFSFRKKLEHNKHVRLLVKRFFHNNYEGLLKYQKSKLSAILKYAYKHSPYYKRQFEKINFNPKDISNFDKLPLLSREVFKSNYNDLLSDQIQNLEYYEHSTGGSSGEPLHLLISPHLDELHQEVRFGIMGYEPGDIVVAFDGSIVPDSQLHKNIYWVSNGNDLPYGRLSYSAPNLKGETIQYYMAHFLDIKPSFLRGFPSSLNLIAEYILKNNIQIPFRIKAVDLTAEKEYEWQIENIKKAFNAPVFFQYGHSEVCVYAYTSDETYEYRCSPVYGFTEVLDKQGIHVKKGETGEIVVTGFYNFVLPFIRYQTGDLAVYNGNENGVVRLEKIVGRSQDFICTIENDKIPLKPFLYQLEKTCKNIIKWQIIQDIPGRVKIKIIKKENFSINDEKEIRQIFQNYLNIQTDFEFVNSIELTRRGKFKFLIQNIKFQDNHKYNFD